MTDNSHETLERIAQRVPVPEPAYDRFLRHRDRKERNRRLRAGALALAVIVVAAAIFIREYRSAPTPADHSIQPPPVQDVDEQPAQRSPIEGLEFPMLPVGAQPSTPITGDAVVEFSSWRQDGGSFVEMAIYADGRVIWHPNQNNVGFSQLRLTPAGVETIRSIIISTGLFDHDLNLRRPGSISRLTILRGGRSVFVQWANASWLEGHKDNPEATLSESRDLGEIERLLGDPSVWHLSSDLYADPTVRPFEPSGFMFQYDRNHWDPSQLPSHARDVLARYDPATSSCFIVTSDVALRIARVLARAGFAPLTNSPVSLDWKLPGISGGGPSNPHLSPVLPHDVGCERE